MGRHLLVLIVGLALVGVVLWLITPSRTARGSKLGEEALPAAEVGPEIHALTPAASPEASERPARAPSSPALPLAGPSSRPEPAPIQDVELARAATGLAVSGRVVDDLGAPLEHFVVQAERVGSEPDFHEEGELSRSFHDEAGHFLLGGFEPGVWTVWGRSEGHAESETVSLTLPTETPIVLVVPRECVVNGRVLAPGGVPIEWASVRFSVAHSRRPSFWGRPEVGTTKLGDFRIDALRPGPVTLQAFAPGWAPSAPESLEVQVGETIGELVLWLRPGATLLGELVDADGRPQSGQDVAIGDLQGFHVSLVTDEQGRFQAHGLPAKELSVWASTREGIRLQERVVLLEGETARVRLAPRGALVRLFGRVVAGGEPLTSARVSASPADGKGQTPGSSSATTTNADGAYELELPGAGSYWLQVYGDGEDLLLAWRATVDVPEVQSYEFHVVIPLGRISGRVTDVEGGSLAGILVRSEPERHEGGQPGSTRTLTDAEGNYVLRVPAGQHAVRAGGDLSGFWDGDRPYAEARVVGLAVSENGHLRDVDFRLETGGMLEGVVRLPDGTGAGRAWVAALGEGRPSQRGFCDPGGRFRIRLAAGSYLIGAGAGGALGDQLACESVRVEIASGGTQNVELELVPTLRVLLSILQDGQPVDCDLQVRDRLGRRQVVQSGEDGTLWIGPLVPGRYSVRAQREGKVVERVLEVGAEEKEPRLEIVFE